MGDVEVEDGHNRRAEVRQARQAQRDQKIAANPKDPCGGLPAVENPGSGAANEGGPGEDHEDDGDGGKDEVYAVRRERAEIDGNLSHDDHYDGEKGKKDRSKNHGEAKDLIALANCELELSNLLHDFKPT